MMFGSGDILITAWRVGRKIDGDAHFDSWTYAAYLEPEGGLNGESRLPDAARLHESLDGLIRELREHRPDARLKPYTGAGYSLPLRRENYHSVFEERLLTQGEIDAAESIARKPAEAERRPGLARRYA